jgi:hypothetical protein
LDRTLTAERIYALGSYQNLKLTHTITDIPDKIALNSKAMDLLQYSLLLDIELGYEKYVQLFEKVQHYKSKQDMTALEFIEQERISTFEQLLTSITPKTGD